MKNIYRLSGWDYTMERIDPMKFQIIPPFTVNKPTELYKFYRVNSFSIDAVTKGYFYASHPFELNDPFDCFEGLIGFENVPLETYKRFFHTYSGTDESYITELFNTNIEKLKYNFKSQYLDFLLSRIGIISLSRNQLDMLMWAHYSNHNGFQATYNVQELEKLFHGPFPINYVEQAEKFDINNDPHLSIVYLSNVKSKCWSYEDEWRCIAESKDALSLPNRPDLILKERKFFYSQETLREIILGFNFFPVNRIFGKEDDFIIYDLSDNVFNLHIDLLDFLVTDQIPTSLIHLIDNLEFKLTKNEIRIAKFGNKKYGFNLKSMK